ncbi:MAG: helix-turn-helix transcriptional regulator [Oscillibacter sp.]|nr:helix-turn-helix transcriptional regulator [Oscillibacter sp.]
MISICFRIRELRQAQKISQCQLAARLGLKSSSTIAMWEKGSRHPSSVMLPRLAKALGCTIDELYAHSPPEARPGA